MGQVLAYCSPEVTEEVSFEGVNIIMNLDLKVFDAFHSIVVLASKHLFEIALAALVCLWCT